MQEKQVRITELHWELKNKVKYDGLTKHLIAEHISCRPHSNNVGEFSKNLVQHRAMELSYRNQR